MSKLSSKLQLNWMGLRTALIASIVASSCGNMAAESENIQPVPNNSSLTQASPPAPHPTREQSASEQRTKSQKISNARNKANDEANESSGSLGKIATSNSKEKLTNAHQKHGLDSVDKKQTEKAGEKSSTASVTTDKNIEQNKEPVNSSKAENSTNDRPGRLGDGILAGNRSGKNGNQNSGGVGGVGGAKGGVGGVGGAKGGVGQVGAILNREGNAQQRLDDILNRLDK